MNNERGSSGSNLSRGPDGSDRINDDCSSSNNNNNNSNNNNRYSNKNNNSSMNSRIGSCYNANSSNNNNNNIGNNKNDNGSGCNQDRMSSSSIGQAEAKIKGDDCGDKCDSIESGGVVGLCGNGGGGGGGEGVTTVVSKRSFPGCLVTDDDPSSLDVRGSDCDSGRRKKSLKCGDGDNDNDDDDDDDDNGNDDDGDVDDKPYDKSFVLTASHGNKKSIDDENNDDDGNDDGDNDVLHGPTQPPAALVLTYQDNSIPLPYNSSSSDNLTHGLTQYTPLPPTTAITDVSTERDGRRNNNNDTGLTANVNNYQCQSPVQRDFDSDVEHSFNNNNNKTISDTATNSHHRNQGGVCSNSNSIPSSSGPKTGLGQVRRDINGHELEPLRESTGLHSVCKDRFRCVVDAVGKNKNTGNEFSGEFRVEECEKDATPVTFDPANSAREGENHEGCDESSSLMTSLKNVNTECVGTKRDAITDCDRGGDHRCESMLPGVRKGTGLDGCESENNGNGVAGLKEEGGEGENRRGPVKGPRTSKSSPLRYIGSPNDPDYNEERERESFYNHDHKHVNGRERRRRRRGSSCEVGKEKESGGGVCGDDGDEDMAGVAVVGDEDEGEAVGTSSTTSDCRRCETVDWEGKGGCCGRRHHRRVACCRCDGERIKTTHENIHGGGSNTTACQNHTHPVTRQSATGKSEVLGFHSVPRCVYNNNNNNHDRSGKPCEACQCDCDNKVICGSSTGLSNANQVWNATGKDSDLKQCRRIGGCDSDNYFLQKEGDNSDDCYNIGCVDGNSEELEYCGGCTKWNESNCVVNEEEKGKNEHCYCSPRKQQTTQRNGPGVNIDKNGGGQYSNSRYCVSNSSDVHCADVYDHVSVIDETSGLIPKGYCDCTCADSDSATTTSASGKHPILIKNKTKPHSGSGLDNNSRSDLCRCNCDENCVGIFKGNSYHPVFNTTKEIINEVGSNSNSAGEDEEEDEDNNPTRGESAPLLGDNNTGGHWRKGKGVKQIRFVELDNKINASPSSGIKGEMTGHGDGVGGGSGRLANNRVGNHNNENHYGHDSTNGISVISDRYDVDGVDGGGGGKYVKRTSVDTNTKNNINSLAIHNDNKPGSRDGSGGGGHGGDEDDADGAGGGAKQCGCGPMRSQTCHSFRRPGWFVLVITLFSSCQGMAINGFVNTVISTLERRFGINSTESGLIASCYDIMFVILVIPVSYFGGHGNKPRYLACGSFIMGLGSFLFCLPHFLSDDYEVSSADETVCLVNVTSVDYCEANKTPDLSYYKYYFFFGQLLHGAGATALYTLAAVYVDENVSQRSSSAYNAVFYTGAIIGPAVGYILGGEFLKTYTDMDVDPDSLGLTTNNPRWVGAWWVGFLITGTFACLLSIPLLAFPPSLPGAQKFAEERGKESQQQKVVDQTGMHKSMKDVVLSVRLLLSNFPFMFINLAAATDAVIVSGFSTFLPKFIEYQYGLTSSTSALYVGLAVVPAGGGATFVGGYLVTRLNLKMKGILRMCLISCSILILLLFNLLLECDTGRFAGVTAPYGRASGSKPPPKPEFDSSCNVGCGCAQEDYYPMCGRDGVMYFSPCYAGCTDVRDDGDVKYYSNCSCVGYNLTANDLRDGDTHMGEFGKCEDSCGWLTLFMLVASVQIALLFIKSMPSLTATLRCVPDHQRSFALGIQWIVARCLGSIPGPILFGKMFDESCSLWQQKCEGSGSCFYYDNQDMRTYLAIIASVFAVLTLVFFFLANWFYVPAASDPDVHLEVKIDRSSSQNTVMTDTASAPPTPGDAYHQHRLPPLSQSPVLDDTTTNNNNSNNNGNNNYY